MTSQESSSMPTNAADITVQTPVSVDSHSTAPVLSKRSEVLRHVFPKPSASYASISRASAHRVIKPVSKLESRRAKLSSLRQSRRRVTLHRVITSIFNHSMARDTDHPGSPPAGSSTSSVQSRVGSFYNSLPSLEVVSPGTFLFSGPSLRSNYSGSFSNSPSRRSSVTEAGSITHSLRRARSETLSIDSFSVIDDGILEPLVEGGLTRTMSDILLGLSTPFDELEAPIFEDDEDGPAFPEQLPRVGSDLAHVWAPVVPLLYPYLDFASWKAMRLTCRSWHSRLTSVAPVRFPPSYHLPVEIIQDIYSYLSPRDFNAARHTCGDWMRASLNKNLLVTMLKRGGWWGSAEEDLTKRHRTAAHLGANSSSEEWFLSRRIARECSLSAGWTGPGLDTSRPSTALTCVSCTDFADLANGYSNPVQRHSAGLVFSTSTCGRLLLVARETLIFVYELRGVTLQPLTTVTSPRRVLSMSMDVTSGRYAVAALLEGRMGMVCELRFGINTGTNSAVEVHVETHTHFSRTTTRNSFMTSGESGVGAGTDAMNGSSSRAPRSDLSSTTQRAWGNFSSVDVRANYDAITLHGTDDQRTHDQNWINHTWNLNLRGAPPTPVPVVTSHTREGCTAHIPIETGTSTFYRHLCSEDDPPRSVAICPQRRCVAFGCSAGIELHWIDALTGQSLSRWFPLTAPSDYLYFLPHRPGFESAKKLRLISSAAHPDDRPAISRKFSSCRPTINTFWGSFGFDPNGNRPGPSGCDHYHALPLNDGHHILFIDPPTGNLFLGCDAPLGGPTKLLRKILLVPPKDNPTPRMYTAAADLTWGARVVVVFDDTLMLYSIPLDILTLSRLEQKAESWDVHKTPPFCAEGRIQDHWLNWSDDHYSPYGPERNSIWPIAIRGVEVGTLQGVSELAIFTHPDITIWAFTLNSQAKTWQLRAQAGPETRSRRYICRSGLVHESQSVDKSMDVINKDYDETHLAHHAHHAHDTQSASREQPSGLDGHSAETLLKRIPKALHVENDEWVEQLDLRGCNAWFNSNGDIDMTEESHTPEGWEIEVVDARDVAAMPGI